MTTFDTSDEFFDWYLSEIEKHVPQYKKVVRGSEYNYLAKKLPPLSQADIDYMFSEIRKIFKIRSNVFLVYDSSKITYYSLYNPRKKRLEIGVPRVAFYHLRYPPIIEAAMQHEMGHILNRDYLVNIPNHIGCVNKCMDIRINHHIDREKLRDLFDAVYYFKTKGDSYKMLVPEDILEDYGMRLKRYGTYSFKEIHDFYHFNDNKDKKVEEKETEYVLPQIGDFVKINKSGKYGQVIEVSSDKVEVVEMDKEDVDEYFRAIKESYYN